MARARSDRLEQVRAWIDRTMAEGYPEELAEMFVAAQGLFDNANRLVALFGVVDEGSVDEAWRLYRAYAEAQAAKSRPTYH